MKSIKMFGKKLPILGIVLIAMLASGGVYAALVSYLSNTVTTSTSVVSPIVLSGEVLYWDASDAVLGTHNWGQTELPTAKWIMLIDGTYAAHLDSGAYGAKGLDAAEARVLIPLAMTLEDIEVMTWDETMLVGTASHVDVYLDFDDDGVADELLTFEIFYNDPNDWPTIDGDASAWANAGPPGGDDIIMFTLDEWIAGEDYTVNTVDYSIIGTTKVIRVEIEVDSWIEESEAYIDDVVINTVTHDLEPTVETFDGSFETPVFAGSEFYFNFDALNQANLEMNGYLDLTITCGSTWDTTPGAEFDSVLGYTFSLSDSTLSLDADASVTFYPEVVKEVGLRLKIAPNVAPDTFTFVAEVSAPSP